MDKMTSNRAFFRGAASLMLCGAFLTANGQSALAADAELTIKPDATVEAILLDDAALGALPQKAFTTTTIWTEGPQEFSGPALIDVLTAAGFGDDHPCIADQSADEAEDTGVIARVMGFFGLGDATEDTALTAPSLRMVAANEYAVEMPCSAMSAEYPIVANRINGEAFSIRDKGPLWLVFPYDSSPDLRTETVYAFSIWQLVAIEAAAQ